MRDLTPEEKDLVQWAIDQDDANRCTDTHQIKRVYFQEVKEMGSSKVQGYTAHDKDPRAHAEMLRRHAQHKKAKQKRKKK